MADPITLFKELFHCQLINQSVSIGGVKRNLYNNGELVASAVIDANCTGERTCKLNLESNSCPKKTNLNGA